MRLGAGFVPAAGGGGTLISSTRSVIATAITPSEKASRRFVRTGCPFVGSAPDPTMDKVQRPRQTPPMPAAGALRHRLARTLNAAYGDGLLSEGTFVYRLDLLLRSPVVDPV